MRLKGLTALITGAGGAMGAAIARRFAEEGASVLLTDISGRRLEAAAEAVRVHLHPEAALAAHRADVTVRSEAVAVLEAGHELGPVDVLVNVVGGIRSKTLMEPLLSMTEERWDATFDLNLKSILHLVQLVGPGMLERRYGKIVNISSINMAGAGGQADYGAAKAAVTSLTRSLAIELAPVVNVNCIAPATIRTSVMDRMSEEETERYRQMILLKRFGDPIDIANAALFLASDEAGFITGEMLCVSGGVWPAL